MLFYFNEEFQGLLKTYGVFFYLHSTLLPKENQFSPMLLAMIRMVLLNRSSAKRVRIRKLGRLYYLGMSFAGSVTNQICLTVYLV